LPFLNSKYKKREEATRKTHIYHHIGARPEVEPPVTYEDLVDNPALWESYTKWLDSKKKKKK